MFTQQLVEEVPNNGGKQFLKKNIPLDNSGSEK